MKKKVLVVTALSMLAVLGSASTALAADGKTEGSVTFGSGSAPKVVKPGTLDEVTPEEALAAPISASDVHVVHAPSFRFGTVQISPMGKEYPAQQAKMTQAGTDFYMPDFLQVADVAGSPTLVWSVTVIQDDVLTSTTGKKLENTRILLYGNKLENTTKTAATFPTNLEGINFSGTSEEIPVKAAGISPLSVLEAKTGGYTNNTISSLVLDDAYDESNYNDVLTPTRGENAKVTLNVPSTDSPEKIEYKAQLTWDLSVTP